MVLSLTVSACPIVASSSTLSVYDKIFWIVKLFVVTGFNAIDYSIFKVEQNRSRNVMFIIRLTIEHTAKNNL